jgi:sec-independent protein translocase protein TatC
VPLAPEAEMSFLDHLEELRWRIFKGLGGVLVASIACLFFADWVINEILLAPTHPDFYMYRILGVELPQDFVLQNRTITGQFFAYFGTVLAVGLILGAPIALYQAWKFIEPALYPNERKGLRFSALFATLFFMAGVAFGYLLITPFAFQFFATFQISDGIANEFDITRYFSMVTSTTFGAGLLFELPVLVFFLSKMGVLTPARLRGARKYALLVILVIAALFTPPDPLSQLIMAVPLVGLYELSIWISAWVERGRIREANALAAEAEGDAGPPMPAPPAGDGTQR